MLAFRELPNVIRGLVPPAVVLSFVLKLASTCLSSKSERLSSCVDKGKLCSWTQGLVLKSLRGESLVRVVGITSSSLSQCLAAMLTMDIGIMVFIVE